jgi:hypothetical protein
MNQFLNCGEKAALTTPTTDLPSTVEEFFKVKKDLLNGPT